MRKLLLLSILFLSGCQMLFEQSEREKVDVQLLRDTAHNQYAITEFQVAMVKAFLGDRINELPASAVTAIDELEQLSVNYDPNTVSDTELGTMFGLRARVFCEVTKTLIGQYAPELILYLP